MNDWYGQFKESIQGMEEVGGPELEEYIEIMEAIKQDVEQRIEAARCQQ